MSTHTNPGSFQKPTAPTAAGRGMGVSSFAALRPANPAMAKGMNPTEAPDL